MNLPSFFSETLNFNFGGVGFEPTYIQTALIVFLIFVLFLTLARLRRLYVHWSFKGFLPSIFLGFILALIVEGFLILGGKTLFTELVGWENAPKPIASALEVGRGRLTKVLKSQDSNVEEASSSVSATAQSISEDFASLDKKGKEEVKFLICEP